MNRLRREIRAALTLHEQSPDGELQATCRFAPEFIGFQGHFPGNPVLPGVCMVQLVHEAYMLACHAPMRLREIVEAKYFRPVAPGEALSIRITATPGENGLVLLHGRILSEDRKAALLKIRLGNGQ